jgi:regulator of protease activity HflC (stomatin/prohibitin superfamily)
MFLGLLIVIIAFLFSGIHKIEEGYVGVYYYTGILQKKLSYPGYNFMIPLLTKVNSV